MSQRIVIPETAFRLSRGKKRPRKEDGSHLKWIRTLPCLVSGRRDGIEAAHIRYADYAYGKRETGGQEKPDDRWTVPLRHDQHKDQHHFGDEREWWRLIGIDPLKVSLALFGVSGDDEAGELIIEEARRNRDRR